MASIQQGTNCVVSKTVIKSAVFVIPLLWLVMNGYTPLLYMPLLL